MSSDTFRIDSDALTRIRVFSAIPSLSRACQYLPRSYWIDPTMITLGDEPHRSRGFAEVYHGTRSGEPVVVKVLRSPHLESRARLRKVNTGVGGKYNMHTRADAMGYSVFMRKPSYGNEYRGRTSSSSMACFTTIGRRQSSHLGCPTGTSPNIYRTTPIQAGSVW